MNNPKEFSDTKRIRMELVVIMDGQPNHPDFNGQAGANTLARMLLSLLINPLTDIRPKVTGHYMGVEINEKV